MAMVAAGGWVAYPLAVAIAALLALLLTGVRAAAGAQPRWTRSAASRLTVNCAAL